MVLVVMTLTLVTSQETNIHQGVKGTRVTWCGDSDRLITTGFSKTSDRQYMVWDVKNITDAMKTENLDTSSGGLIPHFDADTKMLYLAGKGYVRADRWCDLTLLSFSLRLSRSLALSHTRALVMKRRQHPLLRIRR